MKKSDSVEEKRRRRKRQVASCCRKMAAFTFSHIGLGSLVISYSIMGGFLFKSLEAPKEIELREIVNFQKEHIIEDIWKMVTSCNTTALSYAGQSEILREKFMKKFKELHELVTDHFRNQGWDGKEGSENLQWSYPGALLYAVTVITTIGYGHVAPKTEWGRFLTMVYAFVGIPLTFLYLSNIGNFLADLFRLFYKKICIDMVCCESCEEHQERRRQIRKARQKETSLWEALGQTAVNPSSQLFSKLASALVMSSGRRNTTAQDENAGASNFGPPDLSYGSLDFLNPSVSNRVWMPGKRASFNLDKNRCAESCSCPLRETDILSEYSGIYGSRRITYSTEEEVERLELLHALESNKLPANVLYKLAYIHESDIIDNSDNSCRCRHKRSATFPELPQNKVSRGMQTEVYGFTKHFEEATGQILEGFSTPISVFEYREVQPINLQEIESEIGALAKHHSAYLVSGRNPSKYSFSTESLAYSTLESQTDCTKERSSTVKFKRNRKNRRKSSQKELTSESDLTGLDGTNSLKKYQTIDSSLYKGSNWDNSENEHKWRRLNSSYTCSTGRLNVGANFTESADVLDSTDPPVTKSPSAEALPLASQAFVNISPEVKRKSWKNKSVKLPQTHSRNSIKNNDENQATKNQEDSSNVVNKTTKESCKTCNNCTSDNISARRVDSSATFLSELDGRTTVSDFMSNMTDISAVQKVPLVAEIYGDKVITKQPKQFQFDSSIHQDRMMNHIDECPGVEMMEYGDDHEDNEKVTVPISLCLIIIAAYVFCGSLLFSSWENWDYLTGSYFCFITLTTIGFGDIVPGTNADQWDSHGRLVLCALWLAFGLSFLAMCFNLMQEEVREKSKWVAMKLGFIKDSNNRANLQAQ